MALQWKLHISLENVRGPACSLLPRDELALLLPVSLEILVQYLLVKASGNLMVVVLGDCCRRRFQTPTGKKQTLKLPLLTPPFAIRHAYLWLYTYSDQEHLSKGQQWHTEDVV